MYRYIIPDLNAAIPWSRYQDVFVQPLHEWEPRDELGVPKAKTAYVVGVRVMSHPDFLVPITGQDIFAVGTNKNVEKHGKVSQDVFTLSVWQVETEHVPRFICNEDNID